MATASRSPVGKLPRRMSPVRISRLARAHRCGIACRPHAPARAPAWLARPQRVRRLPHAGHDRHLRGRVRCQRAVPERRAAGLRGSALARAEPRNSEDATYLQGLTPAERKLEPGQEWFAVFMQVYNNTNTPYQAASSMTITDTQENTYTPIAPGETNQFAYRAGMVRAQKPIPASRHDRRDDPAQGPCCCTRSRSSRSTTGRSS